jgi:hypothetical protein
MWLLLPRSGRSRSIYVVAGLRSEDLKQFNGSMVMILALGR